MNRSDINMRIIARGREFFESLKGEAPSVFNKGHWIGKVLDWCMKNDEFKVQMFRFVDVFPCLHTGEQLTGHLKEYFGGPDEEAPSLLKWGARSIDHGGAIGAALLGKAIRHNLKELAGQFIVGEKRGEALKNLDRLRREGFAFVVDILGEATVSEKEAEGYAESYLQLLEDLDHAGKDWEPLPGGSGNNALDWGYSPKISISLKPTSLFSQTRPRNFEGAVRGILKRMKPIYEKTIDLGGALCIDMESYQYKEITLEVFRRLRLEYRDYPHLGIALQSYLRETDRDLEELVDWAEEEGLIIPVRLVKGAYWDYETIRAKQNGWAMPVYMVKAESDAAFERHARKILENHQYLYLACASHNIRSIFAVMELAKEMDVPEERYEFQVLYGMAEPIRKGLLNVAKRVRLYCPYGEMVPGMGYLVRRLLENTANECFLRRTFAEEGDVGQILQDPVELLECERAEAGAVTERVVLGPNRLPPFSNEPAVDFTKKEEREAFPKAIAEVRKRLGRTYPLIINGKEAATWETIMSVNPAAPSEVIGYVASAGIEEINYAIAAARSALPSWRRTAPRERASYLLKAAQVARRRIYELSAWQILEIGKQWDQAHADVTEAIDFLEYYARETVRLGKPRPMSSVPGETNYYSYEPKGIAAVIAPWNFPLAISCGMVSAALVTGNCVIYKPSSLTPVVGHNLAEILVEAGLPAGVFNFVPGQSSIIGDFLVEHPDINLIAFTGSMEAGSRIIEKAARSRPGQTHLKKVVCEMGGKNAIIVDDDANLDEAVPLVLASAFGFQGQKCSACSRVIVLDGIYDQFVERLLEAARSMTVGPAEDGANEIGPVADEEARRKILEYIEIGKGEGKLLYISGIPDRGYYVPVAIFGDITPDHRIAQEEIFGPVLAVMRVKDFNQALAWANSTRFALTGGVFSRNPAHLERAGREFLVGNLYLNRQCTGALVERQPFGGFGMSGTGTKAGGPDYLLHFMDPRVVTENTMRRGFIPAAKGVSDDPSFI